MSADYSQIELRVMAYICQDKQMIEGFKEGLDVHSATASVLNGVPVSEVNADMRRIAKTVNFGIMYGLGSFGLSQRLGLSRKESKEIIENYFEKYPGIKKYMELTINETGQKGYAETLCKRRRYFTDINSKNHNLRTSAERGAINMPIQGTSSDMLKIAMNKIFYELKQGNFKSKLIMQVHEELLLEVHNSEKEEIRNIVITNMTNALPLGEVPVLVEAGFGKNWYEAH